MKANCEAKCRTCGQVRRWWGHPRDHWICGDPNCAGALGRVTATTPPERGHLLASPRQGKHGE